MKNLKKRYQPAWLSDHICWSAYQGRYHHDLLPLPYTQEALGHLVAKVNQVQDIFNESILLENLSDYIEFKSSEMKEWEFNRELALQTDANLLLDINNIWVNSVNHGFDPLIYFENTPMDKVKQIHLAGPTESDGVLIDTHGSKVDDKVVNLFKSVVSQWGKIPAMIERDNNLPSFEDLNKERILIEQVHSGS